MSIPSLSIVIPCYREGDIITTTLERVTRYVSERFDQYEIIVVTDGSPDDTASKVSSWQRNHPHLPIKLIVFKQNLGKGAAVRKGFLEARYDWVLMIDADLTIAIEELDHFLPVSVNADLIIASRMLPGSQFEEPLPFHRAVLTRFFQMLQMILIGNFEFSDTQCGFKLFRKSTMSPLIAKTTIPRFAFDAEVLFLAKKANTRVTALPVVIRKDKRVSNVRIVRDSVDMFCSLIKIRWNALIGHYDTHPSA